MAKQARWRAAQLQEAASKTVTWQLVAEIMGLWLVLDIPVGMIVGRILRYQRGL